MPCRGRAGAQGAEEHNEQKHTRSRASSREGPMHDRSSAARLSSSARATTGTHARSAGSDWRFILFLGEQSKSELHTVLRLRSIGIPGVHACHSSFPVHFLARREDGISPRASCWWWRHSIRSAKVPTARSLLADALFLCFSTTIHSTLSIPERKHASHCMMLKDSFDSFSTVTRRRCSRRKCHDRWYRTQYSWKSSRKLHRLDGQLLPKRLGAARA